jgi:hypothetical protein
MAKGQKRSNREKKKPKANANTKKTPAPVLASGMPAFAFNPARAGAKRSS